MIWDKKNYPVTMKNLPHEIKNKAINIANELKDEGYDDDNAVRIAIGRVKNTFKNK